MISMVLFSFAVLFFIFFKGHIFICAEGILYFPGGPSSVDSDDSEHPIGIGYKMFLNGKAVTVSFNASFSLTLQENQAPDGHVNIAIVDDDTIITISSGEGEFETELESLLTQPFLFRGENELTRRQEIMLSKYFLRCYTRGSLVDNRLNYTRFSYLLLDRFDQNQFSYPALLLLLAHCFLHNLFICKKFFINADVDNDINAKKKKLLIYSLSVISYALLMTNVLIRFVSTI